LRWITSNNSSSPSAASRKKIGRAGVVLSSSISTSGSTGNGPRCTVMAPASCDICAVWCGVLPPKGAPEPLWLRPAAVLGALAIPLLQGTGQVVLLLMSTLLVGVSSSFELTARSKYCSLLVERPEQVAPYLASFSVVFNVGKLVGPPLGGWLVALSGPAMALAIDAASYLLPIATVIWLLRPHRELEQRSAGGDGASLGAAWRECGSTLRHVLRFTTVACLVGFFHPGLAPLIAAEVIGSSPQALGLFTSVLAAGSIAGGVVLQRNSLALSERPVLLLGGCAVVVALAQLGMAAASRGTLALAMALLIGAGTAGLLAGSSLILQVGAPMALRGRMAGLGQIAFLGGGGVSGLLAAALAMTLGLQATFALLGGVGLVVGVLELARNGALRLRSA
jgi:MFS family permease